MVRIWTLVGSLLLSVGSFLFLLSPPTLAASFFLRGDVTQDERVNLSDALQVFGFLFGGPTVTHGRCLDALDIDDNNAVEFNDGVHLLFYLFGDGPPPAEPFPFCNDDPTVDGIGCLTYTACPGESRVVFVVDRSSSTCSGELAISKQALEEQINQMSANVEFAIVFYDRSLRSFPVTPQLIKASRANKDQAQNFVASTACGSGTCVLLGLRRAFAILGNGPGIVRFRGSDSTTCPGSDPSQYARRILDEIQARTDGTEILIEADIVGTQQSEFVAGLEELENVTVTLHPR